MSRRCRSGHPRRRANEPDLTITTAGPGLECQPVEPPGASVTCWTATPPGLDRSSMSLSLSWLSGVPRARIGALTTPVPGVAAATPAATAPVVATSAAIALALEHVPTVRPCRPYTVRTG